MLRASAEIREFIKTKEKLSLTAYLDDGGVPTIGWGHTGHDVQLGLTITLPEAEILFEQDIVEAETEVIRLVVEPIAQHVFDALVSFEFNTGGLEFRQDGRLTQSRVLIAVNQARWCDAVEELVRWNNDGGEGVRGLLIRRLEEGLWFASKRWA